MRYGVRKGGGHGVPPPVDISNKLMRGCQHIRSYAAFPGSGDHKAVGLGIL
jgi:hypothetical protein